MCACVIIMANGKYNQKMILAFKDIRLRLNMNWLKNTLENFSRVYLDKEFNNKWLTSTLSITHTIATKNLNILTDKNFYYNKIFYYNNKHKHNYKYQEKVREGDRLCSRCCCECAGWSCCVVYCRPANHHHPPLHPDPRCSCSSGSAGCPAGVV